MNNKIKKLLPQFIKKIYSVIKPSENLSWKGRYPNWAEALKKCTGYESDNILEKVKTSLIKVKNGESVYERDSIVFDKIEYSFPLLSALLWIAGQKGNILNLIDFGGSLGSTYFQNRSLLSHLKKIQWNIVEQKKFVDCGKRNFETDELRFYYNIDECLKEKGINLILFSSVIQYIEDPFELIRNVISKRIEFILFDRTSIINSEDHRLCVQNSIQWGQADSYPVWLFNEKKFLEMFEGKYNLIYDFEAFVGEEYNLDKKTKFSDKGYFLQIIK